MRQKNKPSVPRPPSASRGYKAVPGYTKFCGWCGKTTQVFTNGRMLVCGVCSK